MNRAFRGALLALVGLSVGLASGTASAMSLTWSITGGRFADGGTLSGTFEQNPADTRPSTWNVNVAGGGFSFPARSYTPENSGVLMLDWPPNTELTYHFIDPAAGKRQVRLTPASPLDGSVATVPLSFLAGNGRVECFNCAPFRNIIAGSLVLTSATPTLTLQSIAPDPTVVGASTTATISIDAIAAFGPPTGSITIFDTGDDTICSFPLPATSCSFAPTAAGGLTLFARYTGDANYRSVLSNELSFTTLPAAVTTVTLDPLLPNPTLIGGATTATVHVATVMGYPSPTGLITVYLNSNGNTLCTITLPGTTCTFAPTTGGNQTVGAQYSGDASYASGFSNLQVMTVAPVPPVVTLVSLAPNPTAVGTDTTATATVGTVPPFGPPTGTITVFDTQGNSLCTITLPATTCTFAPTTPGNQTVVARYEGDADYDNGLSNPVPLIVRAPPTIAKAFVPPGILVNGTATLTFTLTNPNTGAALTGVGFTDTFPASVEVAAVPNATTSGCGSPNFSPSAAATSVDFSGGTLAAGGTCSVTVDVTATAGGLKSNITSAVSSTEGGTGGTATAFLVVAAPPAVAPPTIAKEFGAASIVVNGTTTLTFVLTNPNPATALTGVGFTDTLPAGLTVANGAGSACGGTLTSSGGDTIALAGATIAASGTCTFPVTVAGTTAGAKNNVTGAVTSTEGGTGGTASASLTVIAPPTLVKSFGAASIVVNGTTTLTFLLTNPNAATVLTGVGFTDTLPAGLVVATPNGLTGACGGGTITAAAGAAALSLAGATLDAGAPCQFAIDVLGAATGVQVNTTGAVTSANGGVGSAATASITVLATSPIAPIPTLSEFALAVLAIALALIGLRRILVM